MVRTLMISACCMLFMAAGAQTPEHDKIVELGKAHHNFMFRNEPPDAIITDLKKDVPASLEYVTDFMIQTLLEKNKLLSEPYLIMPDDQTLKYIFIATEVSSNMYDDHPKDADMLTDSLLAATIDHFTLCDRYYDILFTAVGNKNQPFNMSKVDFELKNYHLTSNTDKGIFFLECMRLCGSQIFGYMNIVQPPNTKKAMENIDKYPQFNGMPYYQYTDFSFPDFNIFIDDDLGISSYKSYYLDKYYTVLLSHLICLKKEGAKEKEVNDLLLGSILKDKQLYQYSKNKQVLENLFKEQE